MTAPARYRRRGVLRRRSKAHRDARLVSGVLAVILALTAVSYAKQHPGVTILAVLLLLLVATAVGWAKARRHYGRRIHQRSIAGMQRLSPGQFEEHIAALCRRDGCTRVEVVGGAGDLAADVLATTPDGRRILIQAKRYADGNPVRSPALQAVNGTYRQIHGAHLAAVVTTSRFTPDAAAFGQRVGLRMYDAAKLAAWTAGTGPAPWQ